MKNKVDFQKVTDLIKSTKETVFAGLGGLIVMEKGSWDLVTSVDTEINDIMKSGLAKITPEIGFFSEEEAGGIVSDFDGNPLGYSGKTTLVAGNTDMYRYLINTIKGANI